MCFSLVLVLHGVPDFRYRDSRTQNQVLVLYQILVIWDLWTLKLS